MERVRIGPDWEDESSDLADFLGVEERFSSFQ